MPYAITLGLDAEAAASVEAIWQALASAGVSDDALRLGYRPHLTLAVFADDAGSDRMLAEARICAAQWRVLPITLASLGVFPGKPAAVFLAPVVTPVLLERHTRLVTSLADQPVDPHYAIGHFVPHVTLAKDLTGPAAAMAAVGPLRLPIAATLTRIEVVRFRPVEVLASHSLPPG